MRNITDRSKTRNRCSKYPYILTIIDMQSKFTSANDEKTIKNIVNLVTKCKRDNAYIIIAQYMRCGKTLKASYRRSKMLPSQILCRILYE